MSGVAGTTVEAVQVGEHRGFWIEGAEHVLWFRRADGEVVETWPVIARGKSR